MDSQAIYDKIHSKALNLASLSEMLSQFATSTRELEQNQVLIGNLSLLYALTHELETFVDENRFNVLK